MSQLTIRLSDKADALIAQLQKEIFNRRRKKVSAEGVIETLVESGAKSQSDKRFATSWKNLVADIEKAAKVADAHGAKPANLSDDEWALVLSHRIRATPSGGAVRSTSRQPSTRRAAAATEGRSTAPTPKAASARSAAGGKAGPRAATRRRVASVEAAASADTAKAPAAKAPRKATTKPTTKPATGKPSALKTEKKAPARKAAAAKAGGTPKVRSSVARRMARAASRLGSTATTAVANPAVTEAPSVGNGSLPPEPIGG